MFLKHGYLHMNATEASKVKLRMNAKEGSRKNEQALKVIKLRKAFFRLGYFGGVRVITLHFTLTI